MFEKISAKSGDFFVVFLGIFLEGAPYIFLGTLISGFIDAYLPAGTLERILPKKRTAAPAFDTVLLTRSSPGAPAMRSA